MDWVKIDCIFFYVCIVIRLWFMSWFFLGEDGEFVFLLVEGEVKK